MSKSFIHTMIGIGIVCLTLVQPVAADKRIKVIAFQENQVVPIQGKTFTTTQIVFALDETISGVEGGDTAGWIVDFKPTMPNMLFIKPTALNSHSNLTVVTNKHTYYFTIRSNKTLEARGEPALYALRFTYLTTKDDPKTVSQQEDILEPNQSKTYNWHYSFYGNPALKPLHAFDNGSFTFLEFKENQPLPAVFAVEDAMGKEALVNTRREGNYLIVQRLAAQFTLRQGSKVGSLFNQEAIKRIRKGLE